ncbi:MAG TPA: tetratricopeptide repeat protein [Bryobacteraceae bacterium]|nr:tetratricopeptide repeat protein [Bryobacteraceae bacterium]
MQNDLLAQASAWEQVRPDTKPDPDLKVRTALGRAAAHVAERFGSQPLVEASIRQTVGNAYMRLGLFPEAQSHLQRAVELRQRALGEYHPETLKAINALAMLYLRQGKYTDNEALSTRILEMRRHELCEEHRDTLDAMDMLGEIYSLQGKYALAEQILSKEMETAHRVLGDENSITLDAMNDLALVYLNEGKQELADPFHALALPEGRKRALRNNAQVARLPPLHRP